MTAINYRKITFLKTAKISYRSNIIAQIETGCIYCRYLIRCKLLLEIERQEPQVLQAFGHLNQLGVKLKDIPFLVTKRRDKNGLATL